MNQKKYRIIILIISATLFAYSSYAIYKNSSVTNVVTTAAIWDVTLNSNNNNTLSIVPDPDGSTATYTLNVTSQSEVDIIYNIVIDDIPSGVSVQLDNGNFMQGNNGKVIFGNAGTILYSDSSKTKTHTLTFKAAQGTPYTANEELDINVVTRQVL